MKLNVFIKNYKRTERTLLTIQSIKYLFPNIQIHCLNLYNKTEFEYFKYLPYFQKLDVTVHFDKKYYNFGNKSAQFSALNGFYFIEGINKMQKVSYELGLDKVLMIDEDSFFTTGETINFLNDTDYDLAVGNWPSNCAPLTYPTKAKYEVNASILALNPTKLNHLFPIVAKEEFVEHILGIELYDKVESEGGTIVNIPTRMGYVYSDGIHANSLDEMVKILENNNIPTLI